MSKKLTSLKNIKIYLRNTRGQDRLSGFTLLNMERDVQIDYDEIVKRFSGANNQKKNHTLVGLIKNFL